MGSFFRGECIARVVGSTLVCLCFVLLPAANGQVPAGLTAEQLKMYQSLPQAQRDELMKQYGLKAGQGGANTAAQRGNDNSITVNTAPGGEESDRRTKNGDFGPALIKGGEELLVEVAFPEEAELKTPVFVDPTNAQQQKPPVAEERRVDRDREKEKEKEAEKPTKLIAFRDRIRSGNPYKLSPEGVLQLPGFGPINLLGLTSKEVQQRLALDPLLRQFAVAVAVLRTEARGTEALKPFGYEIFQGSANAFVPGTDIPVPPDYVVGPGDVVDVELYGQKSQVYNLSVGRDGMISIPDLGPMNVGGSTFGNVNAEVQKRVRQQLIGTQARVSLSQLRSVRVLVLGDAERPGSYVVSGSSTVVNALFAAGGVKQIGSLRNIQVKRAGRLVRRLDLYDVLLQGSTADDISLQTGDVVFVPPVGLTVGISGDVRRPAIYELASEKSAGDVMQMAGGLQPDADARVVTIERVGTDSGHQMLTIDLSTAAGKAFPMHAGDTIRVAPQRSLVENGITLDGQVVRPRTVAYRKGLLLSDVLPSVDELKPRSDLHYLLIRRESMPSRSVSVLSADLSKALQHPGSAADVLLQPRDHITAFESQGTRDRVVAPLLEELVRQSGPSDYAPVVSIAGHVNAPGKYPLEPDMRVSDLLRAGGGMEDNAYNQEAELTRYVLSEKGERKVQLFRVDISKILAGDVESDSVLQAYDSLTIKQQPEWRAAEQVELSGEVRFPGVYQIRRGETLRSLLDRAGGLTSFAFPVGAVFTRAELVEKERLQLDKLESRMRSDIASLSLQSSQLNPLANQQFAAGQALLDQLHDTKPVGRMVINLPKVASSPIGSQWDVILHDGDKLVLPRATQEVSVLGEVQSATSHLYRPGLTRDDYVSLSGGTTSRADRARIYVVKADGSVVSAKSGYLAGKPEAIAPGDSVIVPFDAEKMRPLPLWTAVTTIVYNLAVATAAIARF